MGSFAALMAAGLVGPAHAQDRPLAGAIRWDAWHGKAGTPGQAVERSLGPAKWHHRLPFFGVIVSEEEVSIDGASQEVMDKEIAYASGAGLDYWAFVTYEPGDAMSIGMKLYLASEHKHDIRFCLITELGRWGTKQTYPEKIRRFAGLMKEETYQKVLDGRPLIYLGFISDDIVARNWGSLEELRKAVDELRRLAREADLGDPYIVIMDFTPVRGRQLQLALGADAISSYATSTRVAAAPYPELAKQAAGFWERCKATGSQVVPLVMSGWDRRPRVEHPVPWETWQKPNEGIEFYYEAPKPAELAAHLKDALEWTLANFETVPASAVIIYAWNENDEGGWLVPTLSEGTARLDALRSLLRP
jgi:hypothetical protein